jgi:hypothetical protein
VHISRRGLLIASVLLPLGLLRGGMPPYYESLLAAHFGRGIAAHPETRRFLDAFIETVRSEAFHVRTTRDIYFNYEVDRIGLIPALDELVDEQLILAFLTSTNVLAALEGKEPLEFSGLFDPYTTPCTNRLATTGGAIQAHLE